MSVRNRHNSVKCSTYGKHMIFTWFFFHTVSTVNIWNPRLNWTIKEDGFSVSRIRSGSGLLVCKSYSPYRGTRIEVWKLEIPPSLLRTRTFEDHPMFIWKVDERFIVVVSCSRFLNPKKALTLLFISTETLEIFTSLTAMNYKYNLYQSD